MRDFDLENIWAEAFAVCVIFAIIVLRLSLSFLEFEQPNPSCEYYLLTLRALPPLPGSRDKLSTSD